MTSKEALKELIENAQELCEWELVRLNIIKQDLDRLEKLEKTFDILTAVLDRVLIFKFKEDIISSGNIYISKIDSNNTSIVNLRKPEYDLLKDVLENGL